MWRRLTLCAFLGGCSPAVPTPPEPPAGPPVAPSEAELLKRRPYVPIVPATYSADAGWPLIVALHGYGGTGADVIDALRLKDLMPLAVLVTPNGQPDSLRNRAWRPGPNHSPFWDVEYLTAIIHDVERKYSIDPARVFVIGKSQGAHMAHRMGCDASNDVAAIVSVAGQVAMAASACAPARAVSVLQVHGDLDTAIGYYGDVQHEPPDPTVPSAHQTVGVWGRNNQCAGALRKTLETIDLELLVAGPETTVEAYEACPAGISVELWTMKGVGHFPDPSPDFAIRLFKFLDDHSRK